jgi:sensor histidine kinase regulating citrate/malate metabolism
VSYKVKGQEVEIIVKDNGEGMPQEMVEKINKGLLIESTKINEHGIVLGQVIKVVKEMEVGGGGK